MLSLLFSAGKIFGLGEKGSKIAAGILGVLVALALLAWLLISYGNSRHADGRAEEKAVWVQAEADYQARLAEASTKADKAEVGRVHAHEVNVAKEREEINEAISEGRSPLDGMFGG